MTGCGMRLGAAPKRSSVWQASRATGRSAGVVMRYAEEASIQPEEVVANCKARNGISLRIPAVDGVV